MGIAVFVIANDFSAINVVIPSIEQDFDATIETTQWVVNAYALTFGVLIAAGPLLVALVASEQSYAALVPGLLVTGLGIGLFYPTVSTSGVTSVDESRTSLAGAIIYMFQIAAARSASA
jgi:MFS family permease